MTVTTRRAFLATPLLASCGGQTGTGTPTPMVTPVALTASDELGTLLAAAPSGSAITLTPGHTYTTAGVDITGKRLTIIGHGATVQCNGAGLVKRDHANKITLIGGRYVGYGAALSLDMEPTVNTRDDYSVEGVEFAMDADFAIRLIGAREGRIDNCTLLGSGLYLRATVSPFVRAIFVGQGKRTAVFYDGTGTGFDAGLVLRDSEVMGWDRGVDVRYTDWLCMQGTTVDYNETANVSLVSQDGGTITGCYLGSKNAAPALHITAGSLEAGSYSSKITVCSEITGHAETPDYDAVVVDGAPDNVMFAPGTHINFYTRYGIRYALNHGRMSVLGTSFAPRGGFGKFPIFNSGNAADSGLLIADNMFPANTNFNGAGITFAKWRDNR